MCRKKDWRIFDNEMAALPHVPSVQWLAASWSLFYPIDYDRLSGKRSVAYKGENLRNYSQT